MQRSIKTWQPIMVTVWKIGSSTDPVTFLWISNESIISLYDSVDLCNVEPTTGSIMLELDFYSKYANTPIQCSWIMEDTGNVKGLVYQKQFLDSLLIIMWYTKHIVQFQIKDVLYSHESKAERRTASRERTVMFILIILTRLSYCLLQLMQVYHREKTTNRKTQEGSRKV